MQNGKEEEKVLDYGDFYESKRLGEGSSETTGEIKSTNDAFTQNKNPRNEKRGL